MQMLMMMRSQHQHTVYAYYISLIARKLSEPDDGCYRPKHVVFYC